MAYLEDVQGSTETMVDDVKAAGSPAVDKGEAIQEDIENGLAEARDSFDQAVDSAKKIDTSNLRAFATGLSNLSQQIQTQLSQASGDLKGLEGKYDVGELNDALKNEPSCKSFTSLVLAASSIWRAKRGSRCCTAALNSASYSSAAISFIAEAKLSRSSASALGARLDQVEVVAHSAPRPRRAPPSRRRVRLRRTRRSDPRTPARRGRAVAG